MADRSWPVKPGCDRSNPFVTIHPFLGRDPHVTLYNERVTSMAMLTDPDALPQLIGEYKPADEWQARINKLFYGLRGRHQRDYSQTFASADHRLAHALAADYYDKVLAREKTLGTPHGSLVIHEWGCGNGNLAASFLSHLKALDKDHKVYPRVRYVMVDDHQDTLDAARQHPDLIDHLERVEILCSDVTHLESVETIKDGSVDRIFCNELWNDLPTKLMLRKEGEFEEEFLRPNLKEHRCAAITDWPGFVRAFEAGDVEGVRGFPPFLEDIIWEKEYRKVDWKDVPFRKTITDMLKQIDEQVLVPVNIGACRTIAQAKRLLAADGIGFSSFDAGTTSMEVLNDPEKPCYAEFGGQFSFMVNFRLLDMVAGYQGIPTVSIEPQREFVGRGLRTNVASLMDLLATHPDAASMTRQEQDRLVIGTIQALNETYESPYNKRIEFPVHPDAPPEDQQALQDDILALKENGLPDTIAYLTEEEIMAARSGLEKLGYEREALHAALAVPPQEVDYSHVFFSLS